MSRTIAEEAKTILLAEARKHVRDRVREILERGGYAVLEAPDGEKALRIVDEHAGDIDLVLSDLAAPGMSGVQLLMELSRRAVQANVLFMSACAGSTILRHGVADYSFALIRRPFTSGELLTKVEGMMAAQPALAGGLCER